MNDDEFYALRKKALAGDKDAIESLAKTEDKLKSDAANGDLNAKWKLNILADDHFSSNVNPGANGEKDAVRKLSSIQNNLRQRAASGDREAQSKLEKVEEILKKYPHLAASEDVSDVQSDLSKMMVKSTAL